MVKILQLRWRPIAVAILCTLTLGITLVLTLSYFARGGRGARANVVDGIEYALETRPGQGSFPDASGLPADSCENPCAALPHCTACVGSKCPPGARQSIARCLGERHCAPEDCIPPFCSSVLPARGRLAHNGETPIPGESLPQH